MSPSTIASTQFSTQQFDVWHDSIEVVFDVEAPSDLARRGFSADVEAFQLGDMVITNATLGEQRYVRSYARARRDGMDHFVLNLYRSGGWRAQTSRGEFEGKAGQVSILDLASDLISDEPNSQLVTLFLPRSLVEAQLPNLGALHGSAPTGPHAVLLAEFLDLLARQLPTLPAGQEQALSRATCEADRLPVPDACQSGAGAAQPGNRASSPCQALHRNASRRGRADARRDLPRGGRVATNPLSLVRRRGRCAALHPVEKAGAHQAAPGRSEGDASHRRDSRGVRLPAQRSFRSSFQASFWSACPRLARAGAQAIRNSTARGHCRAE